MTIPTYDQFIPPLLQYLSSQTEPVRAKDAYEAVAELVGLTPDEKQQMLPSNVQQVFKNRIGWAQDSLKRAKLSSAPRRGYWQITDEGRALHKRHPKGLPPEEANSIANAERHTPLKELLGEGDIEPEVSSTPPLTQSPEELIGNGLASLRASVARDLLEIVGRSSPDFFERLVLDLLHAMGYGESRDALEHVGRSGDGGIDGVIALDRLGLEKVYVQAKRWKDQVGSPVIQSFMGALQLQGATKGVLITSGPISGPARDAAKQARGSVVLVDGDRLASLMIEHGVGVTSETLRVPKIDHDYFEED